jgi:hypothetical protein
VTRARTAVATLPAAVDDADTLANVGTALACVKRPMPIGATSSENAHHVFIPDRAAAEWMLATFVHGAGVLHNEDHQHLEFARIGVLWTNMPNRHQQRWLVGTAEMPIVQGGAWKRGRFTQQLHDWFGCEPDFLITLYGPLLATVTDREFCAVIEHELYHCAHAHTADGAPRYHRDGTPIYGIRGHDVEEFTGVVRRYGALGNAREFVAAASGPARINQALLTAACGTCVGKA